MHFKSCNFNASMRLCRYTNVGSLLGEKVRYASEISKMTTITRKSATIQNKFTNWQNDWERLLYTVCMGRIITYVIIYCRLYLVGFEGDIFVSDCNSS